MPKKLHEKLKREAREKFGTTTSKRAKAYIYGTLDKVEEKKDNPGPTIHSGKMRR